MSHDDNYYEDYDSEKFKQMLNKYEFTDIPKKNFIYQEPRQLLIRNLISKNTIYDNILLYWNLGSGKCLKIDTPIIMYDGTIKKVQDIKIDDILMGDDSKPRTVLSLSRGKDMMYEVIPVKGDSYTVNSEHILCLKFSGIPSIIKNRYNSVTWFEPDKYKNCKKNFKNINDALDFLKQKKIEYNQHLNIINIKITDYINLPKYIKSNLKGYRVPVNFQETDLPIDPYMIGYWLGDGSKRDPIITSQDSSIVKYFKTNLEQYNCYLQYHDKYMYRINGMNGKKNSNHFLNVLKEYNLINNKHIPHIFKCNSRTNRLKLLAGLLDSDGYYRNGYFEFSQGLEHEIIIDDVMYLAKSLGFGCYKKKKTTSWTYNGIKNYGYAWRICISGEGIEEIPTKCPRKKAKSRMQIKDVLSTGIKVKKLVEDNYYGFELDGNHRFLLGDFTVTHNSCAAVTIAEGFKEYVLNMGRKIVVLVKNGNIERNFRNELLSKCSRNEYISDDMEEFLNKSPNPQLKKELMNKINRKINKTYNFITYGTFVNQVLGSKLFEKEKFINTTKQKKDSSGKIMRKLPKNSITDLNNTVIIIDEAHNVTNNDVYIALKKVLENSYNYRLVLLTATPMYDNPKEIIEISNLLNINSKKILPIRNDLFKGQNPIMIKETNENKVGPLLKSGLVDVTDFGKKLLINTLKGKISYQETNTETFPTKIDIGTPLLDKKGTINVVLCYMSDYQMNIYKNALKLDLGDNKNTENIDNVENFDAEERIVEIESVAKSSSLYKNSSDASTMTFPNESYGKQGYESCFKNGKLKDNYKHIFTTDLEKYSSKLKTLMDNINNSPGNVFIYSNYVNEGGTSLIKQLLLANGYKQFKSKNNDNGKTFIVYDDTNTVDVRENQRKIFNNSDNKDGKYIKIIIGSPVISEGITLKNVRQVHILEPAWNMSRINQIIGRAVRHHSHDDLNIDERNVEIYKYCSVSTKKSYFIDKEKYILAEEKDRSNKVVERLLKSIAFDCNINKKLKTTKKDFSPECDYQKCDYKCVINDDNHKLDKFTYNLYINFYEKYDIELITSLIRKLFKDYFIWNIDDIITFIKELEPYISIESIFITLKQFITNKTLVLDKYDREGYIILKGNYFIYNPIDIDIHSSIYSKIIDFSVNSNEYTLDEYMKKKLNYNLDEPVIKPKEKESEIVSLSEDDIKYNENIMKKKLLYGSFRERATKKSGGLFGPIDNKFRIIDLRKNTETYDEDDRKKISGMVATSFNKKKLINIIEYLKISDKKIQTYLGYFKNTLELKDLDINQLISIIQQNLMEKNLILK